MGVLEDISIQLQKGNADETVRLTGEALDRGISAEEILNRSLLAGMAVIGKQFRDGDIFIPEVLIAARAMNRAVKILEPLLIEGGVKPRGKLLIGTVRGDLHDIGKNLASIMFKGAGFRVIDLGVDVSPGRFVSEAKKHDPDIIGLSALLTTTMINMEKTITSLRNNDIQSLMVVGGAPVTRDFAKAIRADIYAGSAADGVDKVTSMLFES